MASYPGAPVVFPARSDGQTIYSQHINALQDEIAAIEASLVGGTLPTPQTIAGTRPTLILDGGTTQKNRLMQPGISPGTAFFLQNLSYDGANWNLDDIAQPGAGIAVGSGSIFGYSASAGANPRSPFQNFTVLADGSIRQMGRSAPMGDFVPIAFNAANFSASSGGVWTVQAGDQTNFGYTLVGRTLTLYVYLLTTTTSTATIPGLNINIPGFTIAQTTGGVGYWYDGSVMQLGFWKANVGGSTITFGRSHGFGLAFPALTDTLPVILTASVIVN